MLKIKSRRSRDGGDHDDAAAAVESISDSPQCSGVNTVVNQLITASPTEVSSYYIPNHLIYLDIYTYIGTRKLPAGTTLQHHH